MKLGKVDLAPLEYLLVYRIKDEGTINTWTLGESALKVNFAQMKKDSNVEFVGIYKKLNTDDMLDIMCS